jgi:hypothetical protein
LAVILLGVVLFCLICFSVRYANFELMLMQQPATYMCFAAGRQLFEALSTELLRRASLVLSLRPLLGARKTPG